MRFIFWLTVIKFLNDRKPVFELVDRNVQNFANLKDKQKFTYLLCSENIPVLKVVGKYILNNIL